MRLGLALLRLIVGGLFMGHGLQKLAGWFGGNGLGATAEGFEFIGLRPGKVHATAAGAAETGGGALLALGAATPVAATLLSGTMATAIHTVHGPKGPWVTNGGYEYNLVLMAIVFALTDVGPGAWSVDAAAGRERWGSRWAVAQLAAGFVGSAAALAYARRQPAPETPDSSEHEAQEPAAAPA